MKPLEHHFNRNITRYRRIVQAGAVFLILAVPVLNVLGYRQLTGTFYSISFWELDIVDPSLMVQHVLLTKHILFPLLLAGFIPLLAAFFLGKIFCGWMCPFNLFAEWGDALRKRLRPASVKAHNKNPKPQPYWFIYSGILILLSITGIPLVTLISMPGLISAQTADLILAGSIGIELAMVPVIIGIEIFYIERFWCRFVCPVGATLAVFRFKNSLSVVYENRKCQFQCSGSDKKSLCNEVCPVQLNPRHRGIYPYCLNCGACVEACQTSGGKALRFSFHSEHQQQIT